MNQPIQLDLFAPVPPNTSAPETQLIEVSPDAWHISGFLDFNEQVSLMHQLLNWCGDGFETPVLPSGKKMSVEVCCLGLDWKPFRYMQGRRPLPQELIDLSHLAIALVGLEHLPFEPDVAIINKFVRTAELKARLGMHQDENEHPTLQQQGSPVVTIIPYGARCRFRAGNPQNRDCQPYTDIEMCPGDAFVMAGASRMMYHGVLRIFPPHQPQIAGLDNTVRHSISIRQARLH